MKKAFKYTLFDFLSEIRDKETIFWFFTFPLLMFFILNLALGGAISDNNKNISFQYVIFEKGNIIKNIFNKIPLLKRIEVQDIGNAISLLKKGKLDIVIKKDKDIELYYVSERLSSRMAKDMVEGIFNQLNLTISIAIKYTKYYMLTNLGWWVLGTDLSPFIKKLKPISYNIEAISVQKKKEFSYKDYLFPGILLMSLITLGAFGIPIKIAIYREGGILKKFFTTPITSLDLFIGSFFSMLIIAIIQFIILSLFSKYVMKIAINPFSIKIIVYAFITFLFSYTMGFFVLSIAKTAQFAATLGNAIFYPLQFLGGLYFPVDNTPWFIKWFVIINPLTYISQEIREVSGILSSPYPAYLSYLVPLIWIGIFLVFSIYKFSWLGEEK